MNLVIARNKTAGVSNQLSRDKLQTATADEVDNNTNGVAVNGASPHTQEGTDLKASLLSTEHILQHSSKSSGKIIMNGSFRTIRTL